LRAVVPSAYIRSVGRLDLGKSGKGERRKETELGKKKEEERESMATEISICALSSSFPRVNSRVWWETKGEKRGERRKRSLFNRKKEKKKQSIVRKFYLLDYCLNLGVARGRPKVPGKKKGGGRSA